MKRWGRKILVGTITGVFLLRAILFVGTGAGIEHDSGWYLGVARNLAERGIYASYTNTITEEGKGSFQSIHNRFSVQDDGGYSYFPAGVTVGPGYVAPEALIIRIFGPGWWQFQAWPLIGFGAMLGLLLATAVSLGGVWAALILALWLWINPYLWINLSFENFSESIALMFLLASWWVFYKKNDKLRTVLWSGVLAGGAVMTKNLFALNLAGFGVVAMVGLVRERKEWRAWIKKWLVWTTGLLAPIIIFEGYRYFYLVGHFGIEGYQAINQDIKLTWEVGGSGLDKIGQLGKQFVVERALIWSEIGIFSLKWPWVLLAAATGLTWVLGRKRERTLVGLIGIGIVPSFVWFLLVSQTGWGRHIWQGIILGMLLWSTAIGLMIKTRGVGWKILALVMAIVLLKPAWTWGKTEARLAVDLDNYKQWVQWPNPRNKQGFPFTSVFSKNDQEEVRKYWKDHITKEDRVYYEGGFLVAELSPIVDQVFFPLGRYVNNGPTNPDGGKSLLIIGPYQKGYWNLREADYEKGLTEKYCQEILFKNDSYTLCQLRERWTEN